jgi:uridine kinase
MTVTAFESVSTWKPAPAPAATPARQAVIDAVADRVLGHGARRLRVVVDGRTGAGKSTFADELASALRARGRSTARASLDDFKRPWRHAQEHGYDRESGEGYYRNAHDFASGRDLLLVPAGPRGDGRVVLCAHDPITGIDHRDLVVALPTDAVLVVDGVFAMRPEYDEFWDQRIWLDVDRGTSRARGVGRDGNPEVHATRYEASEDLYVAEVDPIEKADVVIDHTDLAAPVIVRI